MLPEGLTINPAGAQGLEACTPAQIGIGSANPVACPQRSAIAERAARRARPSRRLAGGKRLPRQPRSARTHQGAAVHDLPGSRIPALRAGRAPGRHCGAEPPNRSAHDHLLQEPAGPVQRPEAELQRRRVREPCQPAHLRDRTHQGHLHAVFERGSPSRDPLGIHSRRERPGRRLRARPRRSRRRRAPPRPPPSPAPPARSRSICSARTVSSTSPTCVQKLPPGLLGNIPTVPLCGEAQASAGECPAVQPDRRRRRAGGRRHAALHVQRQRLPDGPIQRLPIRPLDRGAGSGRAVQPREREDAGDDRRRPAHRSGDRRPTRRCRRSSRASRSG